MSHAVAPRVNTLVWVGGLAVVELMSVVITVESVMLSNPEQ